MAHTLIDPDIVASATKLRLVPLEATEGVDLESAWDDVFVMLLSIVRHSNGGLASHHCRNPRGLRTQLERVELDIRCALDSLNIYEQIIRDTTTCS